MTNVNIDLITILFIAITSVIFVFSCCFLTYWITSYSLEKKYLKKIRELKEKKEDK